MRASVAAVLAPVLVAGGLVGAVVLLQPPPTPATTPCAPGVTPVAVEGVPEGPIAGFDGEQLTNAALVVEAGQALGVDPRGQAIGLMTAMGESSLINVDHGDLVGPDSRGLFQQRDNGAWGTYEERMDPTTAATSFFRVLLETPGWETLPPTIAAHRVQRNADPYHYVRFWDSAVELLEALAGTDVTGVAPGTGVLSCTGSTPFVRTTDGWTAPAAGPLTSGFGLRGNPTGGGGAQQHQGLDLAPGCDQPILSAAAGVVVRAGPSTGYGNLVVVDHGEGILTRYAHMEDDDLLVVVGQSVEAGQQIARIGTKGDSTGCHLHFEVQLGAERVDPLAFFADQGLELAAALG